jgi:DNA-binding XRE family transcriptional regulator
MPKPRRPKAEAELRHAEASIANLKEELAIYDGNPAAVNLIANWLKQQEQKAVRRRRELAEADVFAVRLRKHREAKALTQAELAKRAGLGQAMISLLEQGDRKPSWQTISKLAKALEVGLEEFQ